MSFINNVKSELNANATSSATSIQVVKAVAPYNDPPASGKITLMDSLSSPTKIEIISYTGRTDNTTYWTLTGCTRGAESTTAATWAANDHAIQAFTAGDASDALAEYSNVTVIADITLDADTQYSTGNDFAVAVGATVTVPANSVLVIANYSAAKQL
jgi:hypothetical protein